MTLSNKITHENTLEVLHDSSFNKLTTIRHRVLGRFVRKCNTTIVGI